MKRWWLIFIGLLLFLFAVFCGSIHYFFSIKKYPRIENEKWIHRGLYDNKLIFENTIAAFDSAKNNKINGVELDVFFVDTLNNFIVSHDLPNRYGLPKLLLSEVLQHFDTTFSYWLDLKNLKNENKELIKVSLDKLLNPAIRKKIFIESGNAIPLGYLADNNLNTIYWVQYNRTNVFKKFLKKMWIQWNCLKYPYKGVSIGANLADEDFFKSFANIPKYIFHIYNPELFSKIQNQENVAVYLMDYISDK